MGLSSVFSTAITGLQASETTIDVVGNNVANANTVGFKASQALFATQFLQTLSLGSAPTENSGGTNPRQIGLGTKVAAINPEFSQGTLEISSNPADLAIQGDGFFIVGSQGGEQLYTRNGKFQVNSQSELVTLSGDRLLGFGVDADFQIESTTLRPLTIPLGAAAVAKATQNVFLEGTLTPTGDIADTPEILQSAVLSDGSQAIPSGVPSLTVLPAAPLAPGVAVAGGPGSIEAGTYRYRYVFADAQGNESVPSAASAPITISAGQNITLSGMLDATAAGLDPLVYTEKRIYRIDDGAANPVFQRIATVPAVLGQGVASTTDSTTQASLDAVTPPLSNDLGGNLGAGDYGYYVTFLQSGSGEESRPTALVSQTVLSGRRIRLDNLPQPNPADPGNFDSIRIYRSTGVSTAQHYLVAEIPAGQTSYIDGTPDSVLTSTDTTINPFGGQTVDLNGPSITPGLALVDVRRLENGVYTSPFQAGSTLSFTARKGGRTLESKQLEILDGSVPGTQATTVQNLLDFMREAMGVQTILGTEGGSITGDSRLKLVGNNGVDNSLEIPLSGLQVVDSTGATSQINLGFSSTQSAKGQSAVTDFIVYDSLGIPVKVRVTAVLESRSGSATTYRWFADSPDNDPIQGATAGVPATSSRISVGTGLITFDGEGRFLTSTNSTFSVDRVNIPSASPLDVQLDFSKISGLADDKSSLAATRQDGFPPGKLTSFIIGEDGIIRGVFDNGTERSLGQIRLARFANAGGLEQRGQNLYASGVNSGLPVQGDPGQQGIGSIIAGAVELSNTDIGENLIDLILASTQYRGNTRVITAAQQLLDELLNLRR